MGVKTVEDLVAFQLAAEFKSAVYAIVDRSVLARQDLRYKSQLMDAASGIEAVLDEGFNRNVPGEFAQFTRYALGSLAEARRRLRDGVDRKYFAKDDCVEALALGKRCFDACRNLHRSLVPFCNRRQRTTRVSAGRR